MKDDYFKNEKFSPFKSILGLTTFSTIIPLNVYTSIEHMAKMSWFWPIIHLFVGIIASLLAILSMDFLHLNTIFSAVLVYGFLIVVSGFHHMDGVMDMGDGVMVHGTPERKIAVMKDSMVGCGGIMSAILIAFMTIAGLTNILDYRFFFGIAISEMVGKSSLLTTALTSKPVEGTGAYFINATNITSYSLSIIIVAILCYLLGGFVGVFGLLGAIISGLIVSLIGRKNFGVGNGDVLGASNELGRALSLLFIAIILFY